MSSRGAPAGNGQPERMDEQDRINEEHASMGLQEAMRRDQEVTVNYLRELIEDGAESHRSIVANLLSKDFPLANYTGDERTELKWKFRIIWELFRIIHPNEEFCLDVDDQKWAYDDKGAGLDPLTQEELFTNFIAFDIADSRASRGKGMKQQEMMRKSISESHVRRDDIERENSGILDRIRR